MYGEDPEPSLLTKKMIASMVEELEPEEDCFEERSLKIDVPIGYGWYGEVRLTPIPEPTIEPKGDAVIPISEDVIVIPDVHGRDFWRDAVANRGDREVIFLGDYIDPYSNEQITDAKALEGLRDIMQLKKEHPDKITLLLGNHDAQYIYPELYSGRYCEEHAEEYRSIFLGQRELFKLLDIRMIGGKKFIFSHAGITFDWLRLMHKWFGCPELKPHWEDKERKGFKDALSKYLREDIINAEFQKGDYKRLEIPLAYASDYRSGCNRYGSLLWADYQEFIFSFMYPEKTEGVVQVCGHSQQYGGKPYIKENYACLDCRKAFIINENYEIKKF